MAQKDYDDTEYQLNDHDDDMIYDPGEDDSFADEGMDTSSDTTLGEKKTKFSKLPKLKVSKKRIVILIIMAILLLLVLYKVYSLIFGSSHKPTVTQKPVTIPSIPIKTQQPIAKMPTVPAPTENLLPQAKPPAKVASQKTDTAKLASAQSMQKVQQQLTQFQSQSKQLNSMLESQQIENQGRFSSLDDKISDLQASIGGLQNVIQGLATQVQEAQQEQKAYLKSQSQKRTKKNRMIREHKRYFVQAVIPGRAWLHGADGSSLTVVKGQLVPGYGAVTSIDPYSGVVTTSSGFKIRYGINED